MRARIVSGVAAGALLLGSAALGAAATPDNVTVPPEVGEVQGVAWDPTAKRLWMAGEEAAQGTLIGVSEDGEETRITWTPDGEPAVRGLAIHQGELFVGDIGNEDGQRSEFTVYRFRNLEPGQKQYRAYTFEFPDGAPLEPTALLVSARGNLYVVTDGDDPAFWRFPGEPSRSQTNLLTRVADAPEGVSDAVFLPAGDAIAVRADDGVHVVDAFDWQERAVERYAAEMEAESVTVVDDQLYFVGSGGVRAAEVPVSDVTSTPSAAPKPDVPTASPSPSSSPSTAPEEEATMAPGGEETGSAPSNRGTFIALGAAALVALLAAVATYVVKP